MEAIIKNTRLLVLFTALIIVAGLSALATLPRAEDPHLTSRWGTLATAYPGANAERVEALVTEPLELALRTVPEIKLINSESRPGISVISIELVDDLKETDTAWSIVRDKINDIRPHLPKDALPPYFDSDIAGAFTYITALQWNGSAKPDVLLLNRYAKELAKTWRNQTGTEFVFISGEPSEEILVTLDPVAAAAFGQTAFSLSNSILNADSKNASGELTGAGYRTQVEVIGELDSLERIGSIPIATDPAGYTSRLSDVAQIERVPTNPSQQMALLNGKPAIYISARMKKEMRVDNWTKSADKILDNFRQNLPSNMKLVSVFKQNKYTNVRLAELSESLLIGFSIVLLVLLVTLGYRSAILAALSLPLASAFTLSMMQYTGVPINQMSITGLIVALGIMVDNAIVMVDTIQHYRNQGVDRIKSAVMAIEHLWLPLLGSTLTTILAFSPIFLMPGVAGEFVNAIALTVSFSLVGSYVISHVLISSFAARWLPISTEEQKWYQGGLSLPKINEVFLKTIVSAIKNPIKSLLLLSILPAVGLWSITQLTEQFFPPSDRDMFEIKVFLSPQSSIESTEQLVSKINNSLKAFSDIETIGWVIGNNFPAFYYNMQSREQGAPNFAQAMIKTTNFKTANELIPRLQEILPEQFPQAQIIVRKLEQGPPFFAPIELRLYGSNLDVLKEIGEKIRQLLASTPYVTNTRETLLPGTPKLVINIDDEASAMTGFKPRAIASLLQASTTGLTQGSLVEENESIPVRVRLANEQRISPDNLSELRIPVASKADTQIDFPLSAIASFNIEPTSGAIPHRNTERVNVIEGYIKNGILPQTALNEFKIKLEKANIKLPAGYRMEFGGESAERNDSVQKLIANITVAMTLLFAVVVLSFNSYRLSGIIFLVGSQAFSLGLLSVWAFGYPFGFTVIIALIGLVGLAINDAIVILAELKSDEKACLGDNDAIVECINNCGRHVISTTVTTVGGFMPLMLSGGNFWPPFAVAMAGGTFLTSMVSFYFVPILFKLAVKFQGFETKKVAE